MVDDPLFVGSCKFRGNAKFSQSTPHLAHCGSSTLLLPFHFLRLAIRRHESFILVSFNRERERERDEKVKTPKDLQREKEMEDEARERKKAEKKAREKEAAYQERLRNWEIRERRRIKEYEREKEKEVCVASNEMFASSGRPNQHVP